MKYCCPNCFGDRGLRDSIFPSLSNQRGTCSYCENGDELLLEPAALADVFGPLLNIYEPDSNGKLLVEWLRVDWAIFTNPRMDLPRAKDLLGDILDDGQIVRGTFSPSATFKSDALIRWEELKAELMYNNRYFPDVQLDSGRLEALLGLLPANEIPKEWFRARIQGDEGVFPIEKMGAPPKRVASHGRANPPGIPYLYLGSAPDTAVAEVRPHTGDKACVANFTIPSDIKLVDLRDARQLVSPFDWGDETQIGQLRSDVEFLVKLGEELTRPVLPQGAAIDYVPSQYLCEFIKKCGYQGVVYRSAVSAGMNLALFTPDLATPGTVNPYLVKTVSVEIERLPPVKRMPFFRRVKLPSSK